MDKIEFTNIISKELKLIRTEYNLTQENMAEIIGVSKKTLVEIEKNRKTLSWSSSISTAVIFEDSEIIKMNFGEDLREIIKTIALNTFTLKTDTNPLSKTLGGKIWWNDIEISENYKMQQNLISKHYRIIDSNNTRILSSFSISYVQQEFNKLKRSNI